MVCRTVKTPGGAAIVCGPGQRQRRCKCGRPATLLCDFPVPSRKSGTCDAPLCERCAMRIGLGVDHCPEHHEAAAA